MHAPAEKFRRRSAWHIRSSSEKEGKEKEEGGVCLFIKMRYLSLGCVSISPLVSFSSFPRLAVHSDRSLSPFRRPHLRSWCERGKRRDEEEVGVEGSIPGGLIFELSDMLCNRYFPDSRMCRLVLPEKQSA